MRSRLSRLFTIVSACVLTTAITSCQAPSQQKTPSSQSANSFGSARQVGSNGRDEYASASSNIFVGTVEEKISEVARGGTPESQFRVVTKKNLKGEVPDTAVVNVYGAAPDGNSPLEGGTEELADDAIFVEVGQTYVFYTKHYADAGWFTVSRPEMVDKIELSNRARSAPGELTQSDPAVRRAQNAISLGKPLIRGNGEPLPIQAPYTATMPATSLTDPRNPENNGNENSAPEATRSAAPSPTTTTK